MGDALSEAEYRQLRAHELQPDGSYLPHVRDMGLPEPIYRKPGDPEPPRPLRHNRPRRSPEYLARLQAEAEANAADIVECICARQVKRYSDGRKLNWDGGLDAGDIHLCDGKLDSYRRDQALAAIAETPSVTPVTDSRQNEKPRSILRGVIDVGRAKANPRG